MSVWMDHVKEVRKKCPGMSFKHVLQEAKKTYNKKTQTASDVTSCSNHMKRKGLSKKRKGRGKTMKSRKGRGKTMKSRKGRGKTMKSKKGRGKTMKHKVPKGFRCKAYPNGRGC